MEEPLNVEEHLWFWQTKLIELNIAKNPSTPAQFLVLYLSAISAPYGCHTVYLEIDLIPEE